MKKEKFKELIDSLSCDIEFDYNNVHCSICPFSRDNIALSYGDSVAECTSVDDAMTIPFFNGKSLNDISDHIELY